MVQLQSELQIFFLPVLPNVVYEFFNFIFIYIYISFNICWSRGDVHALLFFFDFWFCLQNMNMIIVLPLQKFHNSEIPTVLIYNPKECLDAPKGYHFSSLKHSLEAELVFCSHPSPVHWSELGGWPCHKSEQEKHPAGWHNLKGNNFWLTCTL